MGEVVAADRGVLFPRVGVVGGNCGHVRRGGGECERRSRGVGIDAASGQIESASLEGGAGGSKGSGNGNGNNDDAHSNNAVDGGNVGLHVVVDPPWAETGDGGAGQQ